jgi:cation:H+ antiporter
MVFFELLALFAGILLIYYFSGRTVVYSTHLAHALRISPLLIGLFLISAGTDAPEIANSVFSSFSGHGDINAGDTFGSALTQISLVLGVVTLVGGTMKAHRRNVLVLGACNVAALIIALGLALDGELSRLDGAILVLAYVILMLLSARLSVREFGARKPADLSMLVNKAPATMAKLVLCLMMVVAGAAIVLEAAIALSAEFGLPEFFISFFVIAIGTSLPELSVELAALRKRRYGLVLGDLLGSNITDATLALGLGPLLFPTNVSAPSILPLGIYVVIVTLIVIGIFTWRKRIGRLEGALIIGLYLLSFAFAR